MDEETKIGDFSNVEESFCASPVRNLTGTPRRIKDLCVDFYNSIQNWNSLCIEGVDFLKTIKDLKMQILNEKETDVTKLTVKIQDSSLQLQEIVDKMDDIFCKMREITDYFKTISELSFHRHSEETVFQTWPPQKFYDTVNEILKMYCEQLSANKAILNHFCHLENEDKMTYFILVWCHLPKITDRASLLLHCMVQETNLL
ncbi:cyclin-dependent kinase 2-interacting protein-like [Centruroides sculpturatus]|uniref:cyclin-dependent kinase 2-interacting protein-like n=1 Tax=Centruroides sculpturatus TaxID=218467 RepID=UPI000C6C894A|nr:cyclin-dependent kinase 2-interacting protein-like [Centruroides sculpturatus]XP_023233601.1 cyclin-dependent kinase 2-interacting protein-like [Centruroides sculpturatus]